MAALSVLWRHADLQVRDVPAPAVAAERPGGRAGAAALVPAVSEDVFRTVGAVGAGPLVRAGGAALRGGSLAAWAAVGAADGGAAPLVAGAAGAGANVVPAQWAALGGPP